MELAAAVKRAYTSGARWPSVGVVIADEILPVSVAT